MRATVPDWQQNIRIVTLLKLLALPLVPHGGALDAEPDVGWSIESCECAGNLARGRRGILSLKGRRPRVNDIPLDVVPQVADFAFLAEGQIRRGNLLCPRKLLLPLQQIPQAADTQFAAKCESAHHLTYRSNPTSSTRGSGRPPFQEAINRPKYRLAGVIS